jgi:hypothetical protein
MKKLSLYRLPAAKQNGTIVPHGYLIPSLNWLLDKMLILSPSDQIKMLEIIRSHINKLSVFVKEDDDTIYIQARL